MARSRVCGIGTSAVVLLTRSAAGGIPPDTATELVGERPAIVSITNVLTGQRLEPGQSGGRGGSVVVFDNLSNPGSSANLNVAYQNAGSYDGSNPSAAAYILPLAEYFGEVAYRDLDSGFPLPTDIVWNDYAADPGAWPAGQGATRALTRLEFVPYFRNTYRVPPLNQPVPRTDTLRIGFFSQSGTVMHGLVEIVYITPVNAIGYFHEDIDLSAMNPPVLIAASGLIMLDFAEPGNVGVGSVFAGGDLVNPAVPRPETLWTTGTTDVLAYSFADGQTGAGGPPALVDPAFDGDPATVSYLDVLNTGAIANWVVGLGDPPVVLLAHDFPCRLTVEGGGASCPCDMDGSGAVTSQDFFDYLVAFFGGAPGADMNGDGTVNSQDFFDFLACFFTRPPGCG
jgi:hypothetical protein